MTIVLQIHSSVTWPYAPHTSQVTTAATYKKRHPIDSSKPFSLIKEGHRSTCTRLCDLCDFSYESMVRRQGLYENNRTIGISIEWGVKTICNLRPSIGAVTENSERCEIVTCVLQSQGKRIYNFVMEFRELWHTLSIVKGVLILLVSQ